MAFRSKHMAGIIAAAAVLTFTAIQASADDQIYTDPSGDSFIYYDYYDLY